MLATQSRTSPRSNCTTLSETVEVRDGTHRVAACLVGWTIGAVKAGVRDQWGLPYFCKVLLNGREATLSVVLHAGDRLEFRRPLGFKAAEDNRFLEADLLIANSAELRAIAAEERSVTVAVRRTVQFCLEQFGRPRHSDMAVFHEVLVRIASSVEVTASAVERIADRLAPQPTDIVDSVWVAERLDCTTTWVADMARQGTIPPSCILPGTGNGKVWKFYRGPIERWLKLR